MRGCASLRACIQTPRMGVNTRCCSAVYVIPAPLREMGGSDRRLPGSCGEGQLTWHTQQQTGKEAHLRVESED